jgi:glucose-1-phosphate thymidylyltransferase
MKGIILAGGTGSRLFPLTKVTNKHLLPVYNKPMIYYPINTLVEAGIKEIMIVSGKGHAGHFLELLGSGNEFGVKFSYGIQEEADGIAHALKICKDFAENDKIIVILGDNILEDNIKKSVENFKKQKEGAKVFLKKVKNPKSFGIAQEIRNKKIITIEEKPKNPKTNLATIGVYMYNNSVWDIINTLKPSKRGELEITDVNNFYAKESTLTFEILKGWWGDCGESFDSLLESAQLVAKKELANDKK